MARILVVEDENFQAMAMSWMIEDAGHWIQQERPAEVSAALLDFLRGLPVRE